MQWLYKIFGFSENTPLTFTQIDFWIFFAFVYCIFALIYKKIHLRNVFLFLVSLYFYYKTSGLFVFLLLFSTVSDYFLGKYIYQSEKQLHRKMLVIVSVFLNLFILSYFKYAYFLTDSYNYLFNTDIKVFNHLAYWANGFAEKSYFKVDSIILPVGISFYTFQTISYSVDIYRRKIKPLDSVLDFGFYVTFFPQLVAGPIVRAEYFVPQILKATQISKDDFNKGTYLIFKGLIKKMLFADFIAMQFLDRVFDTPNLYSGFTNVMALIGYSLQVYGDFSGYTDIAIGLALLMGFTLPKNFDSPYKATSCGNFWKRWHISLSTWLRDYLYIPLGGNKGGSWGSIVISLLFVIVAIVAVDSAIFSIFVGIILIIGSLSAYFIPSVRLQISTNINLMLTMLIGGLWHGASWKYILWGGINGLGIVVSKLWKKVSPYQNSTHWLVHFWKISTTFLFIVYVRLYFRGEDMERIGLWYEQVWNNFGLSDMFEVLYFFRWAFLVMLFGYVTHWLPERIKNQVEHQYNQSSFWVKVLIAVGIVIICYQTYSAGFQPFIYFQF